MLTNPKATRIILFFILLIVLLGFNYIITKSIFPSADTQNLWFYSGIFMVVFSMFFIEPYYTAPTNVVANSITILLILLSIRNQFLPANTIWWHIGIIYCLALLFSSLAAILLKNAEKSPNHLGNIISERLKNISVNFGTGKVLYSGVFLYFIFTYYSINDPRILSLIIFWWFLIVTDMQKFTLEWGKVTAKENEAIGEIFGVQSKKIYLTKLFEDKPRINKFDVVVFKYFMQDGKDYVFKGLVFDTYFLNQEKWAKIMLIGQILKDNEYPNIESNIVYREDIEKDKNIKDVIERFAGIVIENSDIGLIKFEYSKKEDDIREGDLLEINISDNKVFYQVINGITNKEVLEAKNETGYIRGEAIQLGIWNEAKCSFEKFGWVPGMNVMVLKASTKGINIPEIKYPNYKIGIVPATDLPSILNLDDAVSHHIAILGVTGSGKSVIAREIIKQIMTNTKIICVDFTGEYKNKFKTLNPYSIIHKKEGLQEIEENIAKKETATKSRQSDEVLKLKKVIQQQLNKYIDEFIKSKDNLGLFELPDLSNTTFILEFTQMFLESVFKYAKENTGQKICLVIEEAHTVVPETSSLGDLGEFGSNKALVNKIGQIALQGRKYGVGFMIIAQRTANVSKTVLTQCNTVICFQAFDETSFNFLSNYIGKDLVKILPNLQPYHAIIAGKAVKSNIPMIIDVTRKPEEIA